MSTSLQEQLQAELRTWQAAGLKRTLTSAEGLDFTSNDYFGLTRRAEVVNAAMIALEKGGVGAGAARLLRGNLRWHKEAEMAAAQWLGTEAALLFPSGYQANLALLTSLPQKGDLILSDELNHASIIDGCRLSRADVTIFPHQDLVALEGLLEKSKDKFHRCWIVMERVFSMDGTLAAVDEVLALAKRFDASVLLDEAHAAGLFAPLPPHQALAASVVTGGKALGCAGAFICSSQVTIDWFINKARPFVFTTAPPPAICAALTAAIKVIQAEPQLADSTLENAQTLRRLLAQAGVSADGESAIVPVVIGEESKAMAVAAKVRENGFDVRAVRPPTVPAGTSRLRIVCHANHSLEELEGLADAIAKAI